MSEELFHLSRAHIAWMTFVVKEDKADRPLEVTFLGAPGGVADTQDLTHLVEQAGWPGQRQFAEVQVQHLVVEKGKRVTAGGEGPNRIFFGLGNGFQELADLGEAQVARMSLAVEQDQAARPVSVAFAGTILAEARPRDLAYQVEKPRGLRRSRDRQRGEDIGNS